MYRSIGSQSRPMAAEWYTPTVLTPANCTSALTCDRDFGCQPEFDKVGDSNLLFTPCESGPNPGEPGEISLLGHWRPWGGCASSRMLPERRARMERWILGRSHPEGSGEPSLIAERWLHEPRPSGLR